MSETNWKDEIINYIKRNRVSTTEVADCLGKTGSIPGISPISKGFFKVGNIFWVYAFGETNWYVHEQIQDVGEGDIVFVEAFDCGQRAIFGDLVSKYLILYKQVSAIIVTGYLRDAHRLVKENWPIWCSGFNPVGCFNQQIDRKLDENIINERRAKYHGAIGVCDDTGFVVIPKEHHNKAFYDKLEQIESQEDIWYECIDRRKWSTYETVCLKKYLDEKNNK